MSLLTQTDPQPPASASPWRLQPITGAFGAELSGASLTDPDAAAAIPGLLTEHLVLVVRGQQIDPGQQVAVARLLGEPTPAHPVVPGMPGHPEVLVLDGSVGGKNARWHTDVTFLANPHAASVLVADRLPPRGGDTLWTDLQTAYDTLAEPLRTAVDSLRAVHRATPLAFWGEPVDTALSREDALELKALADGMPAVVHPVVRVHPVTGRRGLFVNRGFTSHLVGLPRLQSEGLLALLYAHIEQPEHSLRHRWLPGDVLIWDNTATSHYAVDDYSGDRVVRRVTVRGDLPVGPDRFVSGPTSDPLLTVV